MLAGLFWPLSVLLGFILSKVGIYYKLNRTQVARSYLVEQGRWVVIPWALRRTVQGQSVVEEGLALHFQILCVTGTMSL